MTASFQVLSIFNYQVNFNFINKIIAIKSRKRLDESNIFNRMPIYKWLFEDTQSLDLSEDSNKVSISRALKSACGYKTTSAVLPILK